MVFSGTWHLVWQIVCFLCCFFLSTYLGLFSAYQQTSHFTFFCVLYLSIFLFAASLKMSHISIQRHFMTLWRSIQWRHFFQLYLPNLKLFPYGLSKPWKREGGSKKDYLFNIGRHWNPRFTVLVHQYMIAFWLGTGSQSIDAMERLINIIQCSQGSMVCLKISNNDFLSLT